MNTAGRRGLSAWLPTNLVGTTRGPLGMMLAFAAAILVLSTGCAPAATPLAATPAPGVAGPKAGAAMAWGDGSVLVFVPDPAGRDNNGQKGFWATLNPISNYQYSLCVQAGKCAPPSDASFANPSGENASVNLGPIATGDGSAGYCGWMTGRFPTAAETSEIAALIGLLRPGSASASGVHCVVDVPHPLPFFDRSSAFYDPIQPLESTLPTIASSQTFCQNGKGYQTLDLDLSHAGGVSLAAATGDGHTQCQVQSDHRIVCFGIPGANAKITAGLLGSGVTGMSCTPGSSLDAFGCQNNMHGAAIAGMDDWERDANGAPVPVSGHQLPNGAWSGPVTRNALSLNTVMVAKSLPGNAMPLNGLSYNGLQSNGLTVNGLSVNGLSANGLSSNGLSANGSPGNVRPAIPTVVFAATRAPGAGGGTCGAGTDNPCPFGYTCDPVSATCVPPPDDPTQGLGCPEGYYFDASSHTCVSVAPSSPLCFDGYQFDRTSATCRALTAGGNYPGCPSGQVFDPRTGLCDLYARLTPGSGTALGVLKTVSLQVHLPDCSINKSPSSSCSLSDKACMPKKFDSATCSCY